MKKLLMIILTAAMLSVLFTPAGVALAASATRNLPSSVTAGQTFDVDIDIADYGVFAQIIETLPSGFSYVDTSLSESAVDVTGQAVKFTLLGETSFTYTLKASDIADTYSISGVLKDEDKVEYSIGGDGQVTVPITRGLPPSVTAGQTFDVDIDIADYGVFGQVIETLPSGFSYVDSSLSKSAVDLAGQAVKFTLLGETSFTYTLKASDNAGTYSFSGILKDDDKVEYAVGGDSQVTVSTKSPPSTGGGGTISRYIRIDCFGYLDILLIGSDGTLQETMEART
jgi:hypothetical protein